MSWWGKAVLGSALVAFLVGVTGTPATAIPSKPLPEQWWFTTWGVMERLWPVTQGQGVTVAVIDSGVQADIPDLAGVVLPGTTIGGGGDGRGDGEGHGTGMASLIAAQGTRTGFVGVAPRAKILPIRICFGCTEDLKDGHIDAEAIRYAVDQGAKVINMSFGAAHPCLPDQQEAVSYALEHDVVVVAGAGNEGDSSNASLSPANCAGVLAVGAVDEEFHPWPKTQRQPYVAVAAPGDNVGSVIKDGEYHSSDGGTSSSAALTSAAVALVRSKFPDMTARQVVQQIIGSAGDVGPKGRDDQTGYGLIRPYRILNGSVPKEGPNPVFDAFDKWAAEKRQASQPAAPGAADLDLFLWGAVGVGGLLVVILVVGFIVIVARAHRSRRPIVQTPGLGSYHQTGMPLYGAPPPPPGPPHPPASPTPTAHHRYHRPPQHDVHPYPGLRNIGVEEHRNGSRR